ncbi:response regulator [Rubripirellula reticaptiva]|uniref:Polar-differentiation response regulator DivK n=1 Tax=Rubripirellula reticaptiva TaxID=2528013 RepID=A0A5C6EH14_9BACT|nr:response regulator [Rubripirellula reticaptiva]TWU46529.1 Polar-differentiation response regulator DivK [Rubripirellula reticaptiva]
MTTILLGDDNDDIREMMTLQLEKRGFAVVAVSNGVEAVLATAQVAPALILMDINMPELDGFEATMQIRAADTDPSQRIPVIALTAYALPGDQARTKAAGCNAFHAKPVDFDRLFDQINELIGNTVSTPLTSQS